MYYPKATIAMVNGWCFGGAFTPLVSCDLSIAAEEATFGLSEINWGIIPGGVVTRAVAAKMNQADALVLHHDGRDLRREKGRADGARQRSGGSPTCGSAPVRSRRCYCRRTRPCCAPPKLPTGMSRTWIGKRRKTISAPRTPNRPDRSRAWASERHVAVSRREILSPRSGRLSPGGMMPVAREVATCGLTSPPCGMETGC